MPTRKRVPLATARKILGWDQGAAAPAASWRLVTDLHNRFETALEEAQTRARLRGVEHRGLLATLDLLGFHLRTVLHVQDAMTMAASVEGRPPFLDSRLVKLAVNLPFRCKNRIDLRERDPAGAFRRMQIDQSLLTDSWLAQTFELGRAELDHLYRRADQGLMTRLLHVEVWARVCLLEEAHASVAGRLDRSIAFAHG